MLKKKINGIWKNCYNAKVKHNGVWNNLMGYYNDYPSGTYKYLQAKKNGSWSNVYYPTLELLGYTLPASTGSLKNAINVSNSSTWITVRSYTSSSVSGYAYFGCFPVVSGDRFLTNFNWYQDWGGDSRAYWRVSAYLRAYNSDDSTSGSDIEEMFYDTSDTSPHPNKSYGYIFDRAYDYVGFYLYVYASYGTSSTPQYINFWLQNPRLDKNYSNSKYLYFDPVYIEK